MPLALLLFVSTVLPLPIDTPIPCLICTSTAAQSTSTFSGTVSKSDPAGLSVYDFTSRRLMAFTVPAGFHGVETPAGPVADGTLARLIPGQYTRVTYSSSHGHNVAIRVLVLRRETIPGKSLL